MDSEEDYDYEEEQSEEEKDSDSKMEEEVKEISYESINASLVDSQRITIIQTLKEYLKNEFEVELPLHQLFKHLKRANFHVETAKTLARDNLCEMISLRRGLSQLEVSDPYMCEVCWDFGPLREMIGLECMHFYCKGCYGTYVMNVIHNDVKSAVYLTCPHEGCIYQVPQEVIKRLVDEKEFRRLERFIRKDFLERSFNMIPCLHDQCDKSFFLKYSGTDKRLLSQMDLWCECSYSRCILCEKECHVPLPCNVFELWLKKIEGKDDSVTQSWIKSNTKMCPKCHVQIEKNQGCMHMTCVKCRYEFCWLCMGPWSEHGESTGGYYACNKFKGDQGNADIEKRELEKFNHYSTRYIEHGKSVKISRKSLLEIVKKVEENKKFKMFPRYNFEFYVHAHQISMKARQTVMISNGLSYQIFSDNDRELIDLNLTYAQMRLEFLTKYLEEVKCDEWFDEVADHYTLNKKFADQRQEIIIRTEKLEENIKLFIKDTMNPEKLESFFNKRNMALIRSSSMAKAPSMEVSGWSCSLCTLHNNDEDLACGACGNPKGA